MSFIGKKPADVISSAQTLADGTVTLAKLAPDVGQAIQNSTPAGTVIHVARNSAPSGYVKANGAAVSRTTYAALFAAIGTTFGAGDGATTFNLPDLRGEFIRGWDDGRGVDSGRAIGTAQLDQMQKITGQTKYTLGSNGGFTGAFTGVDNAAGTGGGFGSVYAYGSTVFDSSASPNARVSSTTSGETRARNVALLACIKF
jgi:phage-related tail fiber protein